ncbi:hypothetical protein [Cellulosilyticum sp. WCF-2]|uniref:hypothetical protein n=1 Tax=Cellulosilyticum sp. WCF-2 TaxID=2497860 RepID=UPI0016809026|nr:hypothetical protein [Cellulosilyticum sp. WCF-2]
MVQNLIEEIQLVLKEKLDTMENNYLRAEWLVASFKESNLPESLQCAIIKWFLNSY